MLAEAILNSTAAMMRLRLDFCDFWPNFPKAKNFFFELLSARYEVEICDHPDFLIYSNFGCHHHLYTCPRIFFTGEPAAPNFRECDYAFTSRHLDDPRHLRLPLYVLYVSPHLLVKNPEEPEQLLAQKKKFCAFVVSNAHRRTARRVDFFHCLSRYQQVDSGGRHLNNIGGPIGESLEAKIAFLQPYKFNIAFENTFLAGYTTEKIVDAMRARCIPIYWGSPQIHTEFNPRSFLNYSDFPNEEALIERILQIDRDNSLYLEYLRQPFFHDNRPNEFFNRERLLARFDKIFSTKIRPVGARRKFFQIGRWVLVKKNKA